MPQLSVNGLCSPPVDHPQVVLVDMPQIQLSLCRHVVKGRMRLVYVSGCTLVGYRVCGKSPDCVHTADFRVQLYVTQAIPADVHV